MAGTAKARFSAQLPEDQRAIFERAAIVGGYRSLTEFVFTSAQEKATEIIDAYETLLASEKDRDVFFDALMNPPAPVEKFKLAAGRYKKALTV